MDQCDGASITSEHRTASLHWQEVLFYQLDRLAPTRNASASASALQRRWEVRLRGDNYIDPFSQRIRLRDFRKIRLRNNSGVGLSLQDGLKKRDPMKRATYMLSSDFVHIGTRPFFLRIVRVLLIRIVPSAECVSGTDPRRAL